jgi:hypothetical protein
VRSGAVRFSTGIPQRHAPESGLTRVS